MRFRQKRSIGSSPDSTTVTVRTIFFNINCPACFPHSIFVCFYWYSNWTAVIYLNIISWLNLLMETPCVFCEMRTGCLNIVYMNDFHFKVHSIHFNEKINTIWSREVSFYVRNLELPYLYIFVCNQDPDIIILLCKKLCKMWKSFRFYRPSCVLNTKKFAKKNRHSVQRFLLFGSQDY